MPRRGHRCARARPGALAAAGPGRRARVFVAPGNAGIAAEIEIHAVDPSRPGPWPRSRAAGGATWSIVGPEAPLVAGVADAVRAEGIPCFGPSAQAARIEGSKTFAKDVMVAAGVPTGRAFTCTTVEEAGAALDEFGAPYVVKDDGLAAGKGVVVTSDRDAALDARQRPAGGSSSRSILDGPEVSVFALCDGDTAVPLQPAQDFKRAYDGDDGPNTGGMGAYTPLPWAPDGLIEQVMADVVLPTVRELARRGMPFTGVLYAGLALTEQGPRVIEFNARFGDPETQVVLDRLETPLAGLLRAAATGTLAEPRTAAAGATARRSPWSWRRRAIRRPRDGDVVGGLPIDVEARLRAARGHALTDGRPGGVLGRTGALRRRHRAPPSPTPATRAYDAVERITLRGSPPPLRHRRGRRGRRADGGRGRSSWRAGAVAGHGITPLIPDVLAPATRAPMVRASGRRRTRSSPSGGCGSPCCARSATSASTSRTALVEAYETVVDEVDLAVDRGPRADHPARRQGPDRGVQRARRARAGAQGHDEPGPHRERRADADPRRPGHDPGSHGRRARPAGAAGAPEYADAGDGRPVAQRAGAGDHARQAVRLGGRGAAASPFQRIDGPAGAVSAARHQGPGRHRAGHARPARRDAEPVADAGAAVSPMSRRPARAATASVRSIRGRWTTRCCPRWCSSRRGRRRWPPRSG